MRLPLDGEGLALERQRLVELAWRRGLEERRHGERPGRGRGEALVGLADVGEQLREGVERGDGVGVVVASRLAAALELQARERLRLLELALLVQQQRQVVDAVESVGVLEAERRAARLVLLTQQRLGRLQLAMLLQRRGPGAVTPLHGPSECPRRHPRSRGGRAGLQQRGDPLEQPREAALLCRHLVEGRARLRLGGGWTS